MTELKLLYKQTFGHAPASVEQLKGAGSNRKYYRLADEDGKAVIGAVGTSVEENEAFIYLARHFRKRIFRVPEIYAVSDDKLRYLQEDLGGRSLYDALKQSRENGGTYTKEERELLKRVIKDLAMLQLLGAEGLDWSVCYPQPEFDEENVMFDLNYFKYCFLKPSGVEFNEVKLQKDFKQFAHDLTADEPEQPNAYAKEDWGFMYRDFQARNIMLDKNDNPWYIDFQGGRRGPGFYDVVSFLWQASARYPDDLRQELVEYYETMLPEQLDENRYPIAERNPLYIPEKLKNGLILFRLLQVLGAYGYRGYFERKQHFIDSIPPALENLRKHIEKGGSDSCPYLKKVLLKLISEKSISNTLSHYGERGSQPKAGGGERLFVRITSFSYKKGIPQDPSGNGGGYIFDCRSTNNPGRYQEYKMLTGLDEPVIKFLEEDGEILRFLDSVYKLADFHVARYIERGFAHIMFSFGCTGGQHRSVYSAQHLADHLKAKFGSRINIELTHREQRPQAFILAAGLGTRLKPLTDTMPKALVRVGEKTLLERTIDTLQTAGFQNIVINTHHFADQIKTFVKNLNDLNEQSKSDTLSLLGERGSQPKAGGGERPLLSISDETSALLDTGGGLLKARHKFSQARPILVHNVDILSNADLKSLYASLPFSGVSCPSESSVATLLVSKRDSSRCLMFDENDNLVGWKNLKTGEVRGKETEKAFAFSGIHAVSPTIFPLLEAYAKEISPDFAATKQIPKFGIIDFYLWACQKAKIKAFVQEDLQLTDVGKLDTIAKFNTDLALLHAE